VHSRAENILANDRFDGVLTMDAETQQVVADAKLSFHPECVSAIVSDAAPV